MHEPDPRRNVVSTSAARVAGSIPAVVCDRQLSLTVEATDASVPAARREVAAQLMLWGLSRHDRPVETALLVVSELVTNSVRHAAVLSPRVQVHVSLGIKELTVAVHDRHPGLPRPAAVPHTDGSGAWGLRLVQGLASEAGGTTSIPLDPDGLGKTVTVRLPL